MPIPWERYLPGGFYHQQAALSPIEEVCESPFARPAAALRQNLNNNANNGWSNDTSYFPRPSVPHMAGFPGTYERHSGLRDSSGSVQTSSSVSLDNERRDSQNLDSEKEAAKLANGAEEYEHDARGSGGSQRTGSAAHRSEAPNFSLPDRGLTRPVFPSRLGNKVETIDRAYSVRDRRRGGTTMSAHWRNFSLPSNAVIRRSGIDV